MPHSTAAADLPQPCHAARQEARESVEETRQYPAISAKAEACQDQRDASGRQPRGQAVLRQDPDRQSRRDRLPDHAHRARDGHQDRRGLFRGRCRRSPCPRGRRGVRDRPRALGGELSLHRRRSWRLAKTAARRPCIRAMASCRRTAPSPRRWRRRASSSSARRPAPIAAMGDKIESKKLAQKAGRQYACPAISASSRMPRRR